MGASLYQQGGMADPRKDPSQAARARLVGSQSVIAPGEIHRIQSGEITEAEAKRTLVSVIMKPDGKTVRRLELPEPMSNWELRQRHDRGQDKDEIEAEAIERSYNSTGIGGRIEEYSNGALEWVPNGEGDVPQAPVGDMFYDPIADELNKIQSKEALSRMPTVSMSSQQIQEMLQRLKGSQTDRAMRKFARGGVVRKFQAGGLAAVTLPPDLEEEEEDTSFDPSAATGTEEILAEVDPLIKLREMATMTKDDAMARLRESRNTLAQRRTRQQKGAEQDRWLALAQAMLSPTKTGAFGENVGYAAGALRDVNASTFEQEQAIAEEEERLLHREYEIAGDYFDSLTNLEGFKSNSRARVVGLRDVIAPHDRARIANNEITEAEAERNIVSIIMQPDGTTVSRIERQRNADGTPGEPWIMVDPKKDPSQAAAQKVAENTATLSVQTANKQANDGIKMMPAILRLRRAHNLLMTLDENTSGLNESIRKVAVWAGISDAAITDNTTLAALHRLFGDQVLTDLMTLTGTKTDFEYKKMEELNAGLGKGIKENVAIIGQSMIKMNEIIERGEFAAQMLSESPGNDEANLWKNQYVRFQKESAELMQLKERETGPPPIPQAARDKLLTLIEAAQGNPEEQKRILESFRRRAPIPDDMKVPLRELGAPL